MVHTHHRSRGQAVIGGVLFFLATALIVVGAIASPVVRGTATARSLAVSKATYASSEGALEDGVYRLMTGKAITTPLTLIVGDATVTLSSQDVGGEKIVTAIAETDDRVRKAEARLSTGAGVAFNYGVQTDQGGFRIENSALVNGNAYSNGPVTGQNSNLIKGSVVSAGPSGLIDGVHATSSAYAHTIRNSDIDGNAYYQVISNTSVDGTSYPGSADQATSTLPITEAMIDQWESEALAGGTHTSPCPYTISSGNVTLGPRKINCNLSLSGSATLTLAGPVWVVGTITFQNSATINIASSVGNNSVAMIADNPANRTSSSKITLQNSADFNGNGDKSYILMLSRNHDAKLGGSNKAIVLQNSANGDLLLYAGEGEIEIQNSARLNEVTAWKILLKNSAQITYTSGLANLLFTSGPSGGYTISSWQETQ